MTLEEKIEFIKSTMGETHVSEKAMKAHYDAMMLDTKGGKLYKYVKVSKHSLESISEGTLYCSKTEGFNDPFECVIGVDIASMMDYFLPMLKPIEKFFNVLAEVIKGGAIEQNDSDEEISSFLMNKRVIKFCDRLSQNVTSSEQENLLGGNNLDIFFEFIGAIASTEKLMGEGKEDQLERTLSFIQSKVHIGDLTKKNGEMDLKYFLTLLIGNSDKDEIKRFIEVNKQMYPDQIESIEEFDLKISEMEKELNRIAADTFKIGCLTTDMKNKLMWSHYAQSHHGFCIEYDFRKAKTEQVFPYPVVYSEKRPLIPWEIAKSDKTEIINEKMKEIVVGLLTKDEIWSYENEWRIVIPADMDSKVLMPPISAIYLGAKISDTDKNMVIEKAKEKGIPVKQMVLDRGEYALHVEEL